MNLKLEIRREWARAGHLSVNRRGLDAKDGVGGGEEALPKWGVRCRRMQLLGETLRYREWA